MIAAMKARDKVRKDAISTLVSAAKKAAIDEGCRDDIKEELVNRVILKEMKFCIYLCNCTTCHPKHDEIIKDRIYEKDSDCP